MWEVDQQIAGLTVERGELLRCLAGPTGTAVPAAGPVPYWEAPPGSARETGRVEPRNAQDALLGTGGIMLAFAALVFAAWSYGRLEPAGRFGALALVAVLSAVASRIALSRTMRSTAGCAASIAMTLAVVALWPARTAGLFGADQIRLETWFAIGTGVLAAAAAGCAWVVPVRAWRIGTVVLAHTPVLCFLARERHVTGTTALILAFVALTDAVAAWAVFAFAAATPGGTHLRRLLLTATFGVGAVGFLLAFSADTGGDPRQAAIAYLVLAVVAVAVGYPAGGHPGATITGWLLLSGAAQAAAGPALGEGGRALVVGLCAAALAAATERFPSALTVPSRRAALIMIGKAALLAAPASTAVSAAPGGYAAAGLFAAAVAAAVLARTAADPAWGAALTVALSATAAAAPRLPPGDSRAFLVALVGAAALSATAVLPARAAFGAGAAGTGALLAALWIGLYGHGVTVPEAYTVPLAVVLLAAGAARFRADPKTGSGPALGPGLAVLLIPTFTVAAGTGPDTGRLLLLVLMSTNVLIVGAALRLRGPLTAGTVTLAASGLLLLVPYAAAVPRWVSLGLVGVLLVTVGATYEARRKNLDRARAAFGAFT